MNKEKIVYSNQEEIRKIISNYLISIFTEKIQSAYLFGSSIAGTFGKYKEKYKSHDGSDIDVIVFISENNVPKDWKYLNTEGSWWKLYRAGRIEINGTVHKVEALVVKKDKEGLAKKSKLFKENIIKLK